MKKEKILKRFRGGAFMSLTMGERRAVIRETAVRYNKAGKKKKGRYLMNLLSLQATRDVMLHMR